LPRPLAEGSSGETIGDMLKSAAELSRSLAPLILFLMVPDPRSGRAAIVCLWDVPPAGPL